ncbi:ABC transporter permease subunit [Georgenia sp. Z1344]|uniref:branched-chain amino acid ABC transporter ATP-binding protein/permease n=1 Tax=Georgenia sp. Z1344 TaxID=3416706 RepID=UPI003CF4BFD7
MRLADVRTVATALLVVVLVVLGLVLPVYWVYLLSTVAITALVARSIGVLTNRTGLITLCQMSFAAIGGWVTSWLALAVPDLPFPLLVLAGGLVAAPVGLVIGLATARIRGVELAVVTLGFATALDLVLRQGSFPGVGSGTPVLPADPFGDPRWFFALCWVLLALAQLGLSALGRSRHGLGWSAVRESERAAAALGVRVGGAKASAFMWAALIAGLAGGLLAGQYGLLTPAVFSPMTSMVHLVTAVLCGAAVLGGAVLAGVFSVFVPELLRRVGLPLDAADALMALGAFEVLRQGNGGIMEQVSDRLETRAVRGRRLTCDLPGPTTPRPSTSPTTVADVAAADGPLTDGPRTTTPHPATSPIRSADATDRGPALEVAGLTVRLGGATILDDVSLRLDPAGVHALIGSNGAGKSTLVDAVTGFLPAYDGEVRLGAAPVDALSARARARLGLRRTFQHGHAIDGLTVGQYLRLAGGRAGADRAARVTEFLGLPDADVPIRLMDAGSRRILEIGGALASGPRVLLLDEPAAGLGEAESRALADRVHRIPAELGCATLLIEHDMEFVRAAATRATALDDGHVIASGPVADVLDDPRVVAAYLGTEATA